MLYYEAMFDLTRLRTFRAVVAEGSVNGAAANLGYTPSAVSQQIQTLQRETGLELFERDGRGIVPTVIGERFAKEAEPLLAQAVRLAELAGDLRVGRTGSLRVGHISSVASAWMPSVASVLAREFSDLRLDLRMSEYASSRAEEFDVEVYVEPVGQGAELARDVRAFEYEELLVEPYVAVLPAGHQFARREAISLTDLFSEVWIDNDLTEGGPCRQILLDACAARGFTPSFALQAQSDVAAVSFVEAGAGISIMPRLSYLTSRADPAKVAVVALAPPTPTRRVVARIKKSLAHNPAVRRLIELLHEKAGNSSAAAATDGRLQSTGLESRYVPKHPGAS